jgi:hypothetical protein
MIGTLKRISGPAFIASTATNVYTPPASTIYTVIYSVHVANITSGAVSFTLCVSTTGDATNGTDLFKGQSVAANTAFDFVPYGGLKMLSTDFLTALDGNGAALVITVIGTQVVV